jgi:hypothetical protein
MVVILDLAVDSLALARKVAPVVSDMFALFVATNTKEVLALDVAPKCKEQIFN